MGKNHAITVSHEKSKKPKSITAKTTTTTTTSIDSNKMELESSIDENLVEMNEEQVSNQSDLERPTKKQKLTTDDQKNQKQSTNNANNNASSSSTSNKPNTKFADAISALAWLIAPVSVDDFFNNFWEKKPLHISRSQKDPNYYSHLFSMQEFLKLVKQEKIDLGRNLNIINFEKSEEYTGKIFAEHQEGIAEESLIQAYFSEGWTWQILHLQQFSDSLFKLVSALEQVFSSLVGTNSFITPAHNQGVAPTYEDVELFNFQLEGSSKWKLWKPVVDLPKQPGPEYKFEELSEKTKSLLEVTLHPGDLLYFPRGTIYLFKSTGEDSHHMSISTYNKMSWFELLNVALPTSLQAAFDDDVDFRRGLPRNCFDYMGRAFENTLKPRQSELDTPETETKPKTNTQTDMKNQDPRRAAFKQTFLQLFKRLEEYLEMDQGIDQMAGDLIANRLPPTEISSLVKESGPEPSEEIFVRLIKPSWLRMIVDFDEETGAKVSLLFTSVENKRENHMQGEEEGSPACLQFPVNYSNGLAFLFQQYPKWTKVSEIPIPILDDRLQFVRSLWNEGFGETQKTESQTQQQQQQQKQHKSHQQSSNQTQPQKKPKQQLALKSQPKRK